MGEDDPISDDVTVLGETDEVFFVLERANGRWSPAARVLLTFADEAEAERAALDMKIKFPLRNFGVAVLRSEANHVAKPVQMVRVGERRAPI